MKNYRKKIYSNYISKRIDNVVTKDLESFKPSELFFNHIIKSFFPKDKNIKIVEIGCGHGTFQYCIQKFGYRNSIGVDGSREQVSAAKKLGVDNVIYGNLVEYLKGLKSNSIDLLVALDVIEHFNKEELSDLADDMYRVLKKGGMIISHQPNSEGPFGNFMRDWDFTHELSFTRQSITQLFLSSGFNTVKTYEDKPIPHGVKSFIRFFIWEYIIRKLYTGLRIVETGWCDQESKFYNNC